MRADRTRAGPAAPTGGVGPLFAANPCAVSRRRTTRSRAQTELRNHPDRTRQIDIHSRLYKSQSHRCWTVALSLYRAMLCCPMARSNAERLVSSRPRLDGLDERTLDDVNARG